MTREFNLKPQGDNLNVKLHPEGNALRNKFLKFYEFLENFSRANRREKQLKWTNIIY